MTPYVSFTYFAFLLYPLAAALVLGLLRLLGLRFILLASVVVVALQLTDPLGDDATRTAGLHQLAFLAIYATASVGLVLGYAFVRRRQRLQPIFYGAVAIALLPLVAVKLYPVLATHHWLVHAGLGAAHNGPSGAVPPSSLFDAFGFLGISYMTFRVIDAIITVHDGVMTQPAAAGVASYLLFFPTISAGPIDRFRRYAENVKRLPRTRTQYLADLEAGIHHIARGFLYKFVVAYLIYKYALEPVANTRGVLVMLHYMYAYSFYLFFDFAGYSAFAIGVGRLFGIEVPENFRRPFLSRDFREMWNRWHITLSFWLRDHVYMRFLLTATRLKWFGGNRQMANYAGLFLTFGLMGLWHGLYPHYIVYGLYQGGMMVAYDLVDRWNRRRKLVPIGWLTHALGLVLTFNLFCFGLLIFSGHLFL